MENTRIGEKKQSYESDVELRRTVGVRVDGQPTGIPTTGRVRGKTQFIYGTIGCAIGTVIGEY